MRLRPYQQQILQECRGLMRDGVRTILIAAPTGSGKTVLVAHMLKTATERGLNSWFLCHRRELVNQASKTFSEVMLRHGVIQAGRYFDATAKCHIASVQTLCRRKITIEAPHLIIHDEAHHVAAASWDRIYQQFPNAFHIGLTATPCRLDGTGLRAWFSHLVSGPGVGDLIETGYLSPFKIFAPPGVSVDGVHTRMGDFVRSELEAAADKPTITGSAINEYRKHADGKRALVFAVSIEHSKHIVHQFQQSGVQAAHLDGDTEPQVRDLTIRRFMNGEIKVLSNVELFGEGFDVPGIECCILLRPTKSLGLYLQQVGRALRPAPGKSVAVILDHAGNAARHGMPDERHEFSLDGVVKRNKPTVVGVKVCPVCYGAMKPGCKTCEYCQAELPVEAREIKQIEGELVEFQRREKRKIVGRARSYADLLKIERERGYRRGWAQHIMRARAK